jgi:hypothetical protein
MRFNPRLLILFSFTLLFSFALLAQDEDSATVKLEEQHHDLTESDFPDSASVRYKRISELDYERVAGELGVDVAAIKALSSIEAGNCGFIANGKPVINFDRVIFARLLAKNGISVRAARRKAPVAFSCVNIRRYGSYGEAQHARLSNACNVSRNVALQSTFWGMFQIGGFNYSQCDCSSVEEFVKLMSESEAMQLELFSRFIRANNLVRYIKVHNWYQFSKAYNGGRVVRGYAARMAAAYARFNK